MSAADGTVRPVTLPRLFAAFFTLSLFVLGGGYAILAAADDFFGRRLKWLREGELYDVLPVMQTVPGLIAGNAAVYAGLKIAGRAGAAVALAGVAIPAFLIFLAVSVGYDHGLRAVVGNPIVEGGLLTLRAGLTGIVLGTVWKGWTRTVRGMYGYVTVAVATAAMAFGVPAVCVLLAAMAAGIVRAFVRPTDDDVLPLPVLNVEAAGKNPFGVCSVLAVVLLIGVCAVCAPRIFFTFFGFGCLSFGGGYVLVPLYIENFTGPTAPLLQMAAPDFADVIALTQLTPGPVSVNAATFFGFRMGGVAGAAIATAGLLLPSFLLMTAALTGLGRWRRSRIVNGLLAGVRPATNALLLVAGWAFAALSVWTVFPEQGFRFHPAGCATALFAGWALAKTRLPVVAMLLGCAAIGLVVAAVAPSVL